jgi:hypothetical protein
VGIVCGLDLHRRQITFDAMDVDSGDAWRGRLWQLDRRRFRRWLRDDVAPRAGGGSVAVALAGCTGWRYVVEEITAAGFEAHLAEPADTQAARGRKRHAKTDRSDSRLLRELLMAGELPESWIPPTPVLEWRERVRLYKSLVDHRTVWVQRIHAELYQHGVAVPEATIRSKATRAWLATDDVALSDAGLGAPVTDAGGNVAASSERSPTAGRSRPRTVLTRCTRPGYVDDAQRGDVNRARLAHSTEVIAREVDDHHVLCPIFVAAGQRTSVTPGPLDRPGLHRASAPGEEPLG